MSANCLISNCVVCKGLERKKKHPYTVVFKVPKMLLRQVLGLPDAGSLLRFFCCGYYYAWLDLEMIDYDDITQFSDKYADNTLCSRLTSAYCSITTHRGVSA